MLGKFGSKLIKTVRFIHILAQTEPFGFRFAHLRRFQNWFQTKPLKRATRSKTGTFEILLTCFYYILYLYIGVIYLKMLFSYSHICLLMDTCQILSDRFPVWSKRAQTRPNQTSPTLKATALAWLWSACGLANPKPRPSTSAWLWLRPWPSEAIKYNRL